MPAVLSVAIALIAALAALAAVVLARALGFHPPKAPAREAPDFDPGPVAPEALERLGAALRIATVSDSDYQATDFAPFTAFKDFLVASFPLFHERCELEVVNEYALIYRWPGAGTSANQAAAGANGADSAAGANGSGGAGGANG
ncbi:MAG: hypothetical protein LBD90_02130, partial [Bifidobacteriaceae bacterium]|nr:hypothetical protein [Bifidobacteriaceae bacterium]